MVPHKQRKQRERAMDENDEERVEEALPLGNSEFKIKYDSDDEKEEESEPKLYEEKKAKKPKQSNSNSDECIKTSSSSIMEDEEEEEEEKSSNPSLSGVASSSGITSPPQSTQPTAPTQQQASIVVLSFKNYKKWTKKDGVQSLYDARFKGTSLDNIVQDIKRPLDIHDVDFAIKAMTQSKDFSHVSESTCKSVVNWVNNTLMPKLFDLWNKDQTKDALRQPELNGGAGLRDDQTKPLYDANFDGKSLSKIVFEFEKAQQSGNEQTLNDIMEEVFKNDKDARDKVKNWIKNELIEKNKIEVPSFGYDFEFVDRENSVQVILKEFETYANFYERNEKLEKWNIVLPFIAAAPGVGKSKLLKEVGLKLFKEHFRKDTLCFPLFVSYGNGTKFDPENEKKSVESLLKRMVLSFICSCTYENHAMIFQNIKNVTFDSITIADVLNCITYLLGNQKIDFFLAIDEAHEADTNINNKWNQLRMIMSAIGQYMQLKQLKLYPVFAGTYHTVIEENLKSTYSPQFVPINALLSYNNLAKIFDHLAGNEKYKDKMKSWRTNAEFRHYVRLFAGFPRGIEYFLYNYLTRDCTIREAWESARAELGRKYKIAIPMKDALLILALIFTRREVNKSMLVGSVTLSYLEDKGYIMINEEKDGCFRIVYPPILMSSMIYDSYWRGIFEELFFVMPSIKLYGLNWEDVVQKYLFLKLTFISQSQDRIEGSFTFKDLFPFAKMNHNTFNLALKPIPKNVYLDQSRKQIQDEISSLELGSLSLKMNSITDCYIVKNSTAAQAGDIIIFGLQLRNEDLLLIHVQCKWSDSAKTSESYESLMNEQEKNDKCSILDKKVRNITVIITGKPISNLPDDNDLPDDMIIICKDNFSEYFGTFSDSMKFLCAKHILHINECTLNDLQSFLALEKQ
ncbi:hypothetical protein FDP41_006891 [Naegleria fowleri]|uniref:Uncharacterized protein n=1 Tax=Naegleria fowleri TaxID=5763 RepID=A0A6A5BIK5_NAEFO|nr:uncharacterized protein FDP41_006891 [Naegleria fowleri]KAF0974281.1 hypothetical protein FDP41_006891 [Naegleria fowleri]